MTLSRTRISARTKSGHAVGACQRCGAGIALPLDAARGMVRTCECGVRVRLTFVLGELSETPCNGACMGAVGPSCSCSCGGDNHARWFLPVEYVATWAPEERAKAAAAKAKRTADFAARKAAKAAAAQAAKQAEIDAILAEAPTLAALLTDRYADADGFPGSMRAALQNGYMSPRMISKSVEMVARDAEYDARQAADRARREAAQAAGVTAPTGRVTFSGVITRYREAENLYSRSGGTVHKITVRTDAGWTVHGTLPRGLEPEWAPAIADDFADWTDRLTGQRVTMTATVEHPKNPGGRVDAFYSRPVVPAGTPRLSHLGAAAAPEAATQAAAAVTAHQEEERARNAAWAQREADRAQAQADAYAAHLAANPPAPEAARIPACPHTGGDPSVCATCTPPAAPEAAPQLSALALLAKAAGITL